MPHGIQAEREALRVGWAGTKQEKSLGDQTQRHGHKSSISRTLQILASRGLFYQ